MARKTFADILKGSKISVSKEYDRLVELFYKVNYQSEYLGSYTLHELIDSNFSSCYFRGTCITLADFDETHGFIFPQRIRNEDIDRLVLFCEYSHNMLSYCWGNIEAHHAIQYFENQLNNVLEIIGYTGLKNEDGLVIFVPKNETVFEVSSIVKAPLDYRIIEYHHHSLKGDLQSKLAILKQMADDIEPQRKQLKTVNGVLENNLFQMLQKFVRHNNSENPYIASMTLQEAEAAYDDIYQMWLIAKLELDNIERNRRVKVLLGKINA